MDSANLYAVKFWIALICPEMHWEWLRIVVDSEQTILLPYSEEIYLCHAEIVSALSKIAQRLCWIGDYSKVH